MGDDRDDPAVYWVDPKMRGILPLDGFHLSRSLARRIRSEPFRLSLDEDFAGVVEGCADRDATWINEPILAAYQALHRRGNAHSIELWEGDELVGGVYGVTLGRAFFGESMFSRRRDASKIALAYLVVHLAQTGFELFDTQFLTEHLARLGGIELPRARYQQLLELALSGSDARICARPLPDAHSVVQRITQTSKRA
ncbi:leucyl/phenylalanyl-tRNA--protein transferase [Maritimibacter sp. DP1N21-5]|uniref:leucyl/phenylalanyl-tRNA--protein transferase n=1 Tax=Maritimibacter sp. DP1N21-5 TaxID=2836867 RepID=UPI001C49665A|nr:leucyl/phenylalanyl-tRNA--protein transferase [Maritimibacter sp. DP1N21-5]